MGIYWDEISDEILFDFKEIIDFSKTLNATKRNILKILAMFYDPIGFLQPLIINLKITFQKVCKLKIDWDEEIPLDLKNEWLLTLNCLETLGEIRIPRKMIEQDPKDPLKTIELHGFSDASFQNYGACIYIRTVSESNKIDVKLVTAKSRLAPMKKSTIPRLELLGNLLLSRLMKNVENCLGNILNVSKKFYWTDSQITLSWISNKNKEFKTFVENRVQEIRKNTNIKNWFYIDTKNNPADFLTRFKKLDEFRNCDMWWRGPTFLKKVNLPFNTNGVLFEDETFSQELKTTCLFIHQVETRKRECLEIDSNIFSSFVKLKRTIGWIYRFLNNLKDKQQNRNCEILLVDY